MSLGVTYSPQSQWEGLQVTNFDQCLHMVMVIWKCTDVFRGIFRLGGGLEEEDMLGELSLEEFVVGGENFHEGSAGFSSIIKKKKQ